MIDAGPQRGMCKTEVIGKRITHHRVATGASNIGLHPTRVESNERDASAFEPINRSDKEVASKIPIEWLFISFVRTRGGI